MENFHRILYVAYGVNDETDALQQALSIARSSGAILKALVVCPVLPDSVSRYTSKLKNALKKELQRSISRAREATQITEDDVATEIEVESAPSLGACVMQYVMREQYDLVVKPAEPTDGRKGFMAIDMELLRKCPSAVWLCRPIGRPCNQARVAVAIDPESSETGKRDLSIQLLRRARWLADRGSGVLTVLSCWHYEFERYLRHNIWVQLEEEELKRLVLSAESKLRNALSDLIQTSNILGDIRIHHVKGRAAEVIPAFTADSAIDILVMGTVARSGISGLLIGNTAENILHYLDCSLLTLKPSEPLL